MPLLNGVPSCEYNQNFPLAINHWFIVLFWLLFIAYRERGLALER